MKKIVDIWYVRLPDGREVTARSTRAVEQHIRNGSIPRESRVRRSNDREWSKLERTEEFISVVNDKAHAPAEEPKRPGSSPDLVVPAGLAARLDPMRLRTLGVRGLWEDLIGALDSTFTRKKLGLTLLASMMAGLVVALVFSLFTRVLGGGASAVWSVAVGAMAVAAIPMFAFLNGLLARMVHVELSYMRPSKWREIRQGFGMLGLRLTGAYFFILGGALLLIQAVRWAPGSLAELANQQGASAGWVEVIASACSAIGIVAEVSLWFIAGLSWLLPPVMVVEDLGIFQCLRSWFRLLKQNLSRIILGQALSLATGVVVSLPFAVPVWLTLANHPIPGNVPMDAVRGLVIGATIAPLLAFVAIANVFIYLDVKYESDR
jgi:hypothetical protein